ncbi:MAG: patatin-like phospholipase family protein, partial [Leptospiraceae bacterium]|nr:patatin-like phospholipase family protein [Leptospiraceae bacterium]
RKYIMASCAMPGLFQAQEIDGDLYWDGGIADPIPFEHWLENDRIKKIIVHQVVPLDSTQPDYSKFSFLSGLERSHEIISDELIRLRLEMARRRGVKVFWVRTETPKLGPHRMKRGHINFELGRKAALENRKLLS